RWWFAWMSPSCSPSLHDLEVDAQSGLEHVRGEVDVVEIALVAQSQTRTVEPGRQRRNRGESEIEHPAEQVSLNRAQPVVAGAESSDPGGVRIFGAVEVGGSLIVVAIAVARDHMRTDILAQPGGDGLRLHAPVIGVVPVVELHARSIPEVSIEAREQVSSMPVRRMAPRHGSASRVDVPVRIVLVPLDSFQLPS